MAEPKHISLLELQRLVKAALGDAMPLSYWVAAEISELKVNYSGHCYLELVEKGGSNQVPCAKANAVIWRSTYGALRSYFVSSTGGELAEGMKVLLKVSVTYHELYGFSLTVSDIDPLYTIGDMERQRQETISRLQQDGVFDMNRSIDLPPVIQRIAVVSSRNAAGYQDFMNELSALGFHFHTELFDSFMQGHTAEDSVIGALEKIAGKIEKFDAVVIIRGGGSQSDLAAFDSYRLCCHIAQFPLPVITGIGHDKDRSVADMVAAVSLKTPTAVAGWLVDGLSDFDTWLGEAYNELVQTAVSFLDREKRGLQTMSFSLSQASSSMTNDQKIRIERMTGELSRFSSGIMSYNKNRLETMRTALNARATAGFKTAESRLVLVETIIRNRDPAQILSRGFAIVRSNGKVVRSPSDVADGDILDITLSEGTIKANVK